MNTKSKRVAKTKSAPQSAHGSQSIDPSVGRLFGVYKDAKSVDLDDLRLKSLVKKHLPS